MMDNSTLTIIGSIISVALAVNAYFIKGLIDSITGVRLQVAILVEKSSSFEARLINVERGEIIIREGIHQMRNEFGSRVTLLEMKMEDLKEK